MRLQLALNVSDLDKAVDFYSRMFGVEPAKTRPGYANFAIADPPLKLVLFEGQGEGGSINHLGVETETADEVVAAEARLTETTGVDDTQCCYAAKTETWLSGPDDTRWEWYVKTGDTEQLANLAVAPPPARPKAPAAPDAVPGREPSCCRQVPDPAPSRLGNGAATP